MKQMPKTFSGPGSCPPLGSSRHLPGSHRVKRLILNDAMKRRQTSIHGILTKGEGSIWLTHRDRSILRSLWVDPLHKAAEITCF